MAKKKEPPANPVTPEADALFAMHIREWQHKLNLRDWRIERSNKPAGKGNAAEIAKCDLAARLATWQVGADFGSMHVNETTVEQMACHEVLHVFLKELIEFCRENDKPEDMESAEHRVINSLVHLLVPGR